MAATHFLLCTGDGLQVERFGSLYECGAVERRYVTIQWHNMGMLYELASDAQQQCAWRPHCAQPLQHKIYHLANSI